MRRRAHLQTIVDDAGAKPPYAAPFMTTRRDPGRLPARAVAVLGALVVVATMAAAPVSPGPSAQPSPTPVPSSRPATTPRAPATAPSTTTVRPMLVPVLAAPAVASFADGHLVDAPVFTGLTNPTTVRFASDGRAFVAEKRGVVKEFDTLADPTPTVVIDLQTATDDYWDRGLLSLAIDPHFLSGSPYLYLYLVYDAPPGGTAPTWNDTCPTPPGGTTDGCTVTSELLRITVNTSTNLAVGSPTLLIHDWCQQFPSHAGGAMAFDASGKLLVTGGDGASFSGKDYGQRGGTLPNPASPVTRVNPCGDPTVLLAPNPDGTPVTEVPTAEGGSLRSQDIRTTGDSTGLAGTLIRVDPATGNGTATNPLAGSADANNARIVAHGFRNPFRMTIRPGTNEVYLGDVGDQTWEEIDKVVPPSGPLTPTTLPNFGWPCYEGTPPSGWQSLGINMCAALYGQANAVTPPLYAYSHTNALSPTGPCFVGDVNGRMSSSISGLAFYEGASGASNAYPAKYDGALFFADYSRNCLGVLLRKPDGTPDPTKMETVATGLAHPVDLLTGAGGDLYYVDLDGGRVMRISYHTEPVARATATPSMAHAPVTVHLDGSTSVDPDPTDSIASYHWDLNHNGIFDEPADGAGVTFDWAIATPAVYTVTLKVVTVNNQSATTDIVIDATNDPPVPSIDLPSASLTWTVGDTITFGGSASDREDGTLGASHLSWELVMVHCPAGCHNHFIQSWNGVTVGSFVAPDHEYPSHLELRLTATDSHGSSTTTAIELQPRTSTLTVTSSLPGAALTIDGAPAPSPTTITVLRGGTATVAAPLVVTSGGKRYRFSRWTDSVAAVHDVAVAGDTSLTATYVADAPETCASATTTSASGAWVADTTSGNGDQDWFRFTLPSKHRVVVTAGSLPVDATMELWSSCGKRLAVSDAGGTHYEQITKVLAAGTYRVHVVAKRGARSDLPYAVQFRPMSSGLPVVSSQVTASGGQVRIVGEVMANTGATRGRVTVTATFRNAAGKVVGTLHGTGFAARLSDGARTSFVITGAMGAYASVRLTVTGVAAAVTVPSVSITSLVATAGLGGTATETGSVKNRGTSTARSVSVARTWYGTRGEVLAVGWATVSPTTLAKGASGTFTVHRPAMPTYNGSSSQVRATF
jgi:glucose/arabinose dehydrogenase